MPQAETGTIQAVKMNVFEIGQPGWKPADKFVASSQQTGDGIRIQLTGYLDRAPADAGAGAIKIEDQHDKVPPSPLSCRKPGRQERSCKYLQGDLKPLEILQLKAAAARMDLFAGKDQKPDHGRRLKGHQTRSNVQSILKVAQHHTAEGITAKGITFDAFQDHLFHGRRDVRIMLARRNRATRI